MFLEDWDFELKSLPGFVQAAIHNTEQFLCEMSFEDVDRYIEVIPIDVAEAYQAFREQIKPQTQQIEIVCREDDIVNFVQETMDSFARRVVDHVGKK